MLYLTWWFPSVYRTRMMGIFQSASVVSLFIGPPIGGLLLLLDGFLGLHGWQWLYIAEGLPPIIMCFVSLYAADRSAEGRHVADRRAESLADRAAGLGAGSARGGAEVRSERPSPARRCGC